MTPRFASRAFRSCTLFLAVWLLSATALGATPNPATFDFALLGDPQIGYGPGSTLADAGRFRLVVEHLTQSHLRFTVIPGDLVQSRSLWQRLAFDDVLNELPGRKLLTPGNHDVIDRRSLAAYRARYGPDYQSVVLKDCAFITINSETARTPSLSAEEYQTQWHWLEQQTAKLSAATPGPVFFVTHRPPFIHDEAEPGAEVNWPIDTRNRLLALARKYGVRWILSGHAHQTLTANTHDGIQVVVLAGTASSFDQSPIGYSHFSVKNGQVSQHFVSLATAPTPPPSIPGLRGWTPRLLDFSLRHWLFTIAYLATAAIAFIIPRRRAALKGATASDKAWRSIAWLMLFFGINMQLDFDELLTEIGRGAAKLTGIYPLRHFITGGILLVFSLATIVYFARQLRSAGRPRGVTLALLGLVTPTAWFCLSAASNHVLDMLFDEAIWDLLNLGSMVLIVVCAWQSRSRATDLSR